MWRKIGIIVAAIILVIVVAAAVAPYFVGLSAESSFKARVALTNARYPGVHIEVESYDRGFYSSEATLTVAGSAGMAEETQRLWAILLGNPGKAGKIHLHISHGPIPFAAFGYGHWNFMPVLYTAEFRAQNLPPMSIVGAFKPQLYVVQYFSGATRTTLTVPPGRFSLGVFGVTWEGGHMVVNLDAEREYMHMNAFMKPVNYQLQDPETGESYTGTLHGFTFSSDIHKAEHDFWVGQSQWAFKGSEYKVNGEESASIAPSTLRSTTQLTGDGRWLGGSVHLAQTGGSMDGWEWTKLSLDGSIGKLDAPGLRQAIDAMDEPRGDAAIMDMDNLEMLYQAIPKVVTPETSGNLDLILNAPDGQAELHATLSFDAPKIAPITRGAGLGTHADLKINLDFDRKLVNGFSQQVLGAPAAASINEALQAQVNQGYLQRRDGGYHATIRYRSGMLTINGKTVEDESDRDDAPQAASAPVPATAG